MTRSADFTHTVKHGVRASQPDIVVHARRLPAGADAAFPEIGFVVSKSVGNAVDRHRVARRLRHVARIVVADLDPADRIVVRALPSSRDALSTTLRDQLVAGVRRVHHLMERHR
jgi:ribonuclease P protein component